MQIRNSVGNVVGTSRAIGRSKRSLLDFIYFSRLAKLTDASSVFPFRFRDSTSVCLVWLTRHVAKRSSKRAPFVARTSCSDNLPSRWLLSSFSYFPNSEYSQDIVAKRVTSRCVRRDRTWKGRWFRWWEKLGKSKDQDYGHLDIEDPEPSV